MSQNNGNGLHAGEYPETEVGPRATRRRYSREYKQRMVEEIAACETQRQKTAILRREGLYATLVSKWRDQLQRGGVEALEPHKRGPKPNPAAGELARLQQENERLRRELAQAQLIIEVQKKVSQLLNLPQLGEPDEPQ